MSRIFALSLLVVLGGVSAAHSQMSFDSDVCYVQYKVSLHTDQTMSQDEIRGHTTSHYVYDAGFEIVVKLDLRSPGQVLSMTTAQLDPAKLQNMTPAEQMKMSQQMLEAMQYTANWMPGAPDVGSGDAMLKHTQAVSVPVHINYALTTTGDNLVDEMGGHFDVYDEETMSYSGNGYTSPDQVKFEMNTSSKKYWLSLPFNFKDMTGQAKLQWVSVSKSRQHGQAAWDPEERNTQESGVDVMGGGFRYDRPADGPLVPTIEGTIGVGGKITGEKSYSGHLDRLGPNVPVTLTYTYTVTNTPPAKK